MGCGSSGAVAPHHGKADDGVPADAPPRAARDAAWRGRRESSVTPDPHLDADDPIDFSGGADSSIIGRLDELVARLLFDVGVPMHYEHPCFEEELRQLQMLTAAAPPPPRKVAVGLSAAEIDAATSRLRLTTPQGEYASGDELRVLRCAHYFHAACIDDWLS
eukprot:gene45643-57231_t